MNRHFRKVIRVIKLALCVFLTTLLFHCNSALSQSKCQELKTSFGEDWFPVSFVEPKNDYKVRGIGVRILELLAKEHNVTIHSLNPVPWKRAILWMESGHADVLAGHYWTKSRAEKWLVSNPIFVNDIRAFYISNSNFQASSLLDLLNYTGAYPAGVSFGDEVDQVLLTSDNTQSFKDNPSIISALLNVELITLSWLKVMVKLTLKKWN